MGMDEWGWLGWLSWLTQMALMVNLGYWIGKYRGLLQAKTSVDDWCRETLLKLRNEKGQDHGGA